MKEIDIEELKRIQIEILDKVDEFCNNTGIHYFLSSGTLIGAIRHKGYIPWDDDVDIYMPRKDYEMFLDNFNGYDSNFRVISLRNVSDYPNSYSKVERAGTLLIEKADYSIEMGVNIDVFPVDGVPDDILERKKYMNKAIRLFQKMELKKTTIDFERRGLLKNIILAIGKLLLQSKSLAELAKELDAMIDKDCEETEYVCSLVSNNKFGKEFPRSVIEGTVEVEFEGKYYKTMRGWDTYLRVNYGDYMQLPPEEKRITHHSYKAFWK